MKTRKIFTSLKIRDPGLVQRGKRAPTLGQQTKMNRTLKGFRCLRNHPRIHFHRLWVRLKPHDELSPLFTTHTRYVIAAAAARHLSSVERKTGTDIDIDFRQFESAIHRAVSVPAFRGRDVAPYGLPSSTLTRKRETFSRS